jgi:hypothetical protein
LAWLCAFAALGDEPQWLKDARAREGGPVAPAAIASKDGWFRARLPAKVADDIEKVEGSYTVTIDVGSEAPAHCEVIPEGFDMADMLRQTFDASMKVVGEEQGKVEATQLEFTDAGAIGNVPFLATRWVYRVNDGKEPRLGGLKQVAFDKLGHGVYCAHLDLGYVATFDAVVRAFAESFEAPAAEASPYYMEIMVANLGGSRVGVATVTLEKDTEGDTKAEEVTSMIVLAGNGKLHSQDAIHREWLRPDATLINAAHFVADDGELSTSLNLAPREDLWAVEGELQGKEINLTLPAGSSPGTSVQQALALRKLLAAGDPAGAEHSIPMWMDDDPTKLTDVRTRLLQKSGDTGYAARTFVGPLEIDVVLDTATGTMSSAEATVGPLKLVMERVYQSGSF